MVGLQTQTVRVGKRTILRESVPDSGKTSFNKAMREIQESTPVNLEAAQKRAETILAKLQPKKQEAGKFLQEVERKKALGALQGPSYEAERKKGLAVLKLIGTIEAVYVAAIEQQNTFALGRVSATSNYLSSLLQTTRLLKHETYLHTADHADTLAAQIKTSTRRVFDQVINYLDKAPEQTGILAPSF